MTHPPDSQLHQVPHAHDAHPPPEPQWGAAQMTYAHPPPGRFARLLLRMWDKSPTWLAPAAILVCFAGAVGYVLAREPIDGAGDETTCLVKMTTGFACPGCGGTRAFFYLVQADLPAAARHHLIFVFAVPFLFYAYLAWAGNKVFRWRLPQLRPSPWMIGAFLGAAGVFTVLRNLPISPFTWFYV